MEQAVSGWGLWHWIAVFFWLWILGLRRRSKHGGQDGK